MSRRWWLGGASLDHWRIGQRSSKHPRLRRIRSVASDVAVLCSLRIHPSEEEKPI